MKRFVTVEAENLDKLAKMLSEPSFTEYKIVWIEKLSKWLAFLELKNSNEL